MHNTKTLRRSARPTLMITVSVALAALGAAPSASALTVPAQVLNGGGAVAPMWRDGAESATFQGRPAVPAESINGAVRPAGAWTTFANGDDVLALLWDEGVLWSGARNGGLTRWEDGAAVQFLRPQSPLGGNTVRDIERSADGRLWLATDGGLSVLDHGSTADRGDDRWHTYTVESTYAALPSNDVRAVAVDGNTVWVGTWQVQSTETGDWFGGGLARLDHKGTVDIADDVWAPVTTFESTFEPSLTGDDKVGLVSDNINDLAVNADGNVWVATSPHWRLTRQRVGEEERITWVRGHGGISFVDTKATFGTTDDKWTAADCEEVEESVTCTVQAISIAADGIAWAAVGGRGILYFRSTDTVIPDERSRRINTSAATARDFVEAILPGPGDDPRFANTLFLATREGGLSVLDHRGTLRNLDDDIWDFDRGAPFRVQDGLSRDRLQALAFGGGKLWIGTGAAYGTGGGIHSLDLVDLNIGAALHTPGAPPTNFITDIAFGQPGTPWENHVWVATGSRSERRFGQGVVDIDTRGTADVADDIWTHYTTLGTDADGRAPWSGLAGDNVHAVEVRGDRIWFGSIESVWHRPDPEMPGWYLDGGLSVFSGGSWTVRNVENTGGEEVGLRDASVSAIASGCDGELWIGTGNPWDANGAGVAALSVPGSVHVRTEDVWALHDYAGKAELDSIPSRNITSISVDCSSRDVWASGTHHVKLPEGGSPGGILMGGGASDYDLDLGAWTRHDTRHGLQSFASGEILAEAITVLADSGGAAWVGTYGNPDMDSGDLIESKPYWPAKLNRWDGAEWSADTFERGGWVSSVARDLDGRLWAATSRGGAAREAIDPDTWRADHDVAGLWLRGEEGWEALWAAGNGPASNDNAVVRVAPDGSVWVGSEGGGIARFRSGDAEPTPTPTTTGPRPTVTPTFTPTTEREPTPTGATSTPTPSPTSSPGPTRTPDDRGIFFPFTVRVSYGSDGSGASLRPLIG